MPVGESLIPLALPAIANETGASAVDWTTILASFFAALAGGAIAIIAQHFESNRVFTRDYGHRLDAEIAEYVKLVQRWFSRTQKKPLLAAEDERGLNEIEAQVHAAWLIARGPDKDVLRELVHTLERVRNVTNHAQLAIDVRSTSSILRAWRNESHDRAKAIERLIGVAASN